ncbi:WhiB family transcriptional regulator [Kitasatospora sp. NPDC058965]|uniref:WhiB family transcriptional regulator n=1 Tax=Kitasatospora sp. NPDC058965 TaxID=3346682 RepID=UPI0036B9B038
MTLRHRWMDGRKSDPMVGTHTPGVTARPTGSWMPDFTPAPDTLLPGAACKGVDPDMFFPEPGDEFSGRRAKAICATCPVREMCLARAMDNREEFGIFGGLDETERTRLRRREQRARSKAAAAAKEAA